MRATGLLALLFIVGCGAGSEPQSSAPATVESAKALVPLGMLREDVESALGGPGIPVPSVPNGFRYTTGDGALIVRYEKGAVASVEVGAK